MPEYLKFRCCMCPNINTPENTVCPPGPFKSETSSCRFVKGYISPSGWKYRVKPGIGGDTYKARYQDDKHIGSAGWHCMPALPWRKTFDEAQADLNNLAAAKAWKEWNPVKEATTER